MKYPINAEKTLATHELRTGEPIDDFTRQAFTRMMECANDAYRQGLRDALEGGVQA